MAVIEGKEQLLAELKNMRLRAGAGPGGKTPLFADAGHYMTFTAIPLNFRQHGPGWPSVRRGGSPLIDTGRLRQSISYTANSRDVVIGSRLPWANIHNRGGVVHPRVAQYLALPLVPPLRATEARTKGPRDFADTFIHKSKAGNLLVFQRMRKGIRAIFLLLKSTRIRRRPYLIWKLENLQAIGRRWVRHIGKGDLPTTPNAGGSTDRGEKRR